MHAGRSQRLRKPQIRRRWPIANDNRAEQPQTRIRGFLARTRLDINSCLRADLAERVDHGRALIEELALAFDVGDEELSTWSGLDCADVADFLGQIEPRPGRCFCNDTSDEPVNITCGYREVLRHMSACLRELAQGVSHA